MNKLNSASDVGSTLNENAGLTDAQLLTRYLQLRDQAAFEALICRHGKLVFGICRRILKRHHEAEDAFQATFLSLAQDANQITRPEMVANWLYTVARYAAIRVKKDGTRRRRLERELEEEMNQNSESNPVHEELWSDLAPVIDREMGTLSDELRIAIILCDVEGKTRKEAARQLGWPEATVSTRLTKARSLLAQRLKRHGVVLTVATLSLLLTQHAASAAVPVSLVTSTLQTAGLLSIGQAVPVGAASSKMVALAQGTTKSMTLISFKTTAAALLVLATAVLGLQIPAEKPKAPAGAEPAQVSGNIVLPAEIQEALEQNAKQLSPITISYTAEYKSPLSEQEILERYKLLNKNFSASIFKKRPLRAAWQDRSFHVSVQAQSNIPGTMTLVDAMLEWSFDGAVQYRGTRYEDHKTPANLSKNSIPGGRIGELPSYVLTGPYMNPYFKKFSGLTFRQIGDNPTDLEPESEVLGFLRNGGTLVAVEDVLLNELPLVKLDVVTANETRQRADAVDLNEIRSRTKIIRNGEGGELQLEAKCPPEAQDEMVENLVRQQSLPETRRLVFYLDPALHYAVRRREEWYGTDQLLDRCDCSEFEKLPNRPVWLPRHCENEMHEFEHWFNIEYHGPGHIHQTAQMVSYLFEDSILSMVLEVREMSGAPIPLEQFVLNYTEPGTNITEELSPPKDGGKRQLFGYQVGRTPEETARNKNIAAKEQLDPNFNSNQPLDRPISLIAEKPKAAIHWFLIINGIVLLFIGSYFAYRRFRKS